MYGRSGLVRRRPLLRAAAVGGTFAAGRAMGRRAAEQAGAETYQDQRLTGLEGQPVQPLLRATHQGEQDQPLLRPTHQGQQNQPLLRATHRGEQDQPLLRPTHQGQQSQPLLRPTHQGQQNQPLLRPTHQGQQNQPLMRAAPPEQSMGLASAADQLSKLAELHQQGELTDDEFAAAKAKTLGVG